LKNLGPHLNLLTYDLLQFIMWVAFGSIRDRWRKERLGLPKGPIFRRIEKQQIPILAAYSSYVVPKPVDWPEQAWVTGYWYKKLGYSLVGNTGFSRPRKHGRPAFSATSNTGPQR
ncbi:unnamed protein product, partial [marine sediment metagenome]